MAKTIKKRDGRTVEFDRSKILNAIKKALVEEEKEVNAEAIAETVEAQCSDSLETVESIQDRVEAELIKRGLVKTARNYILYRQKRTEIREAETSLMKTMEGLFAEKGEALKENANINGTTVSGTYYRIGSEASKSFYKKHMLPEDVREAFERGRIHIHDFDYYGLSINCMQHDLGTMFKKGFYSGNCFITEPQSIYTAMMLTCVILQSGQTDLFGGESVPAWDHYMEPYVQKSFEKYFSKYLSRFAFAPVETQKKWVKEYPYLEHTPVFENDDLYRCYSWAKKDTEAETYQAAQAMLFNTNGLCSRAGGQVVFSSLNLGTCTKPGGRLAVKALFTAMDKGIGKSISAIYPIVIFKLKDGISYSPKDPNYDLRLMAEKTTAKRQFPNFSNLDAPYNLKYYKEGHPETEVAYMGCLAAHEQVIIRDQDKVKLMSIEKAFKYLDWKYGDNTESAEHSKYIQLEDTGVSIYDSAKKTFVPCKGVLRNPDKHNWKKITLSNGRLLLTTADHPLPVVGKGRTQVSDLVVGDKIPVSWNTPESVEGKTKTEEEAWLLGLLLCDGCYASSINVSLGLDEDDILNSAKDILEHEWELSTKVTKRERGEKGNYFDLYVTGTQNEYRKLLRTLFGGVKKNDRHLPEDILSWNRKARLSFLAGMVDADGYINKTEKDKGVANRVQLGSTNPVIALQQLYLAQSLGYPAKIYENHYKKDSTAVRYRVEFGASKELVQALRSSKKNIWTERDYTSAVLTPEIAEVESVVDVDYSGFSYDFETESDRFDVSGVNSHNCRTRVVANVNGPEIVTARGNLSFTTLNLPRLAIEAMKETDDPEQRETVFFKKLDETLAIATKQLQERFEIQCKRHVYNFPYVMQQGAYMGSEFLSPTDTVEKALLNGTLSFGFVGLAEALVALTGHDHADGEPYQQLGLKIVKYIRDYADKLTAERHMNWTLIATPAESVAGRFLRLDKAEFGIIPGVTDKDYYTNSNHVPVGKKVTASEKIRIEAPYHALTNAGHIAYVELEGDPRDNLDALHQLVNQMHDAGVGYFSFNAKMDTCTNCGYVGIIGDICPSCGQKESVTHPFIRPRRVTGYLSLQNRFNAAKLAELHDRVTHV